MTTQVNEKYVLSEEEVSLRKAMNFLKGCGVGYAFNKGAKYKSTKEYQEDFAQGLRNANTKETKITVNGRELTRRRIATRQWATVCHIVHNRLRHNRPHTGSYESDQKFLTDFSEERWANGTYVKEFQEVLSEYGVSIPGLPLEAE